MKSRAMRILRWVVIVGAACFVVAQFFGPAKTNPVMDSSQSIESHVEVTPQVAAILDRSCNDCHSNKTRWPWYSNVAPVSWFVIDHVNHGRRHLNFSEWQRYTQRDVDGLLRQICGEVKAGAMPLSSYTPLHPGSKLSTEDVQILCDWTNAERDHSSSSVGPRASRPQRALKVRGEFAEGGNCGIRCSRYALIAGGTPAVPVKS